MPPLATLIRLITVACAPVLLVAGCADRAPVGKSLAVLASGDTQGWIVPCGCETHQSGGLPRRATLLRKLREQFDEVIYVDVGGAGSGESEYDRMKFEAILKGEKLAGIAAHNIGSSEARFGVDYLRRLTRELDFPFVSCNVYDTKGECVGVPIRVVTASGIRLALIGVLSDRKTIPNVRIVSPREAILETLAECQESFDALVVLAYMPENELVDLASDLPEADIVVGGPTQQSVLPRYVGPTLVASATNKGKFVALFATSLAQLNCDNTRDRWQGDVLELTETYADAPPQLKNVATFRALLSKRDLKPAQTSFGPRLPMVLPAGFRIAGTETCCECHEEEDTAWHASHHATAWQSLVDQGTHVDPFCQRCHATGYGMPGGFESLAASADRTDVGCECCHGPSLAHKEDPDIPTAFQGQEMAQCRRCHDRENSPDFDPDVFWKRIRHGSDADAGDAAKAPANSPTRRKGQP